MIDDLPAVDVTILSEVVTALNKLDPDARARLIQSISTLYGVPSASRSRPVGIPEPSAQAQSDQRSTFSEDRTLSPKEFVWQKKPKTAIERVVCLAYYLEHYRGAKQFKTGDIAALNTEAAQVKFSNAAMMVGEATRAGYLSTVAGQEKQLTVIGEHFVMHLPDHEAAMEAIKHIRPKRPRRKTPVFKEEV